LYAFFFFVFFFFFFFFFQAEDGIRDFHVTGVQTCALPIFSFDYFLDGTSLGSFWIDFHNSNGKLLFGYYIELDTDRLNYTIADKPNSFTASRLKYANGQLVIIPKSKWITLELYVDYNNSKVYYSIPSLNHTVAFNMLPLDP